MRLIDATSLEKILNLRREQCSNDYGSLAGAVAGCLKLVQVQPTIAPPPNNPLTLEELREMDGEPVWVERPGYGKNWALVNVWAKSTNIIYLTCNNGMVLHPQPELDSGAKIYRRKPEEGIQ